MEQPTYSSLDYPLHPGQRTLKNNKKIFELKHVKIHEIDNDSPLPKFVFSRSYQY